MKARLGLKALPKREQEAVIQAAKNIYRDEQKKQVCWMWAVVLWRLHETRGFGEKRLKETLDDIYQAWIKADERYEFDRNMTYGDYCEAKLREIGIDINDIYKRFEGE